MKKITIETLLLWLLVGFLSLGQLGRFLLAESIRIYPHDVLIFVWLVFLLIKNRSFLPDFFVQIYTKCKRNLRYVVPVLGSTTVSFLMAALHTPHLLPLLYTARILLYLGFAVVLWKCSKLSKQELEAGILSMGLITLALGFLQLLLIPDTRFLFALGFDDHYYRMIGTQLDPAFLGALLLVSLSAGVKSKLLTKHKNFKLFFVLSHVLGIILTFSRATYLGICVLGAYYFFTSETYKPKHILHFLLASILFGSIAVISASFSEGEGTRLLRTASISARISTIQTALPQTAKSWLIGEGPFYSVIGKNSTQHGTIEVQNQAKVSDSLSMLVLQGWGLVGLASFTYVAFKLLIWLYRNKNHEILQLSITMLVISQFNNTLLQPFVLVSILVLLTSYARSSKEYT